MEINNSITLKSEVSDLLINEDFLKNLYLYFYNNSIPEFVLTRLSEKEESFISEILNSSRKLEKIEYSKEEILELLGSIFSLPGVFNDFLDLVKKYSSDKRLLNLYIELGDYLIPIYKNKDKYPASLGYLEEKMQTRVSEVLSGKILDPRLKLLQNGFSQFTEDGVPIDGADFENIIKIYVGEDGENQVYIKVTDILGASCFINKDGKFLRDFNGKKINEVYYHFYFGDYLVLKFQNSDFETKLEISSLNPDKPYTSEGLDSDASKGVVEFENGSHFEFLTLYGSKNKINSDGFYFSHYTETENVSEVFDINMKQVTVLDILKILNQDNNLLIKTLSESDLNDLFIRKFGKMHNLFGRYFMELEVLMDGDSSSFECVIRDDGKILHYEDKKEELVYGEEKLVKETVYPKHLLGENFSMFGKYFIGVTEDGKNPNGFMDRNLEVIKTEDGEVIRDIRKSHFEGYVHPGKETEAIYFINGREEKWVLKSFLEDFFLKYTGYNEVEPEVQVEAINRFEIPIGKGELIIDNRDVQLISLFKDPENELICMVYFNGIGEAMDYEKLVSYLQDAGKTDLVTLIESGSKGF